MTFESNYVTNLPWGTIPAGTPCFAQRLDAWTILLAFEDGTKIQAKGHYWLKDLEDTEALWQKKIESYEHALMALIAQKSTEDLEAEEDARVFEILSDVAGEEEALCGKS